MYRQASLRPWAASTAGDAGASVYRPCVFVCADGREPGIGAGRAGVNVIVSAGGRFHSFELARQLEQRGLLQRLYTAFPKRRVYEVDRALVRSHPRLTLAHHLLRRSMTERANKALGALQATEYDRWVARH